MNKRWKILKLQSLSPPNIKKPRQKRGFFIFGREIGLIKSPVRSTRVRLLGRIAQEDVDEGDARRARAMDKVRPGTGREGSLGLRPESIPLS
jgi:hypothetical protein